jgi:AcrR family transcriptional regulator
MARTPKVVEDRREQIIDAAVGVFAQKGFVRATNKDIARQAGITPGLIYHYFESKEALLQAIVEARSPVQLIRSLSPQMVDLPPEMLLRFLIQQVLSIVESEQFVGLIRVLLPEVIHNPTLASLPQAALQEATHFLENYLEMKMVQGALRPGSPVLIAQTLLGCMMGFVLRRQILRDPVALQFTQEQIVESIVSTTLQGLLPR